MLSVLFVFMFVCVCRLAHGEVDKVEFPDSDVKLAIRTEVTPFNSDCEYHM